jgi:hypothetical protein
MKVELPDATKDPVIERLPEILKDPVMLKLPELSGFNSPF